MTDQANVVPFGKHKTAGGPGWGGWPAKQSWMA